MSFLLDLFNRPIIFVGGKGGVGKTTSAACIAVRLSTEKKKTLIISTDPAHSLGDALDRPLSGEITSITPYLDAIELDTQKIVDMHFKQIEDNVRQYTNPDMFPKVQEFLKLSKQAPGAEEAAILEAICTYLVRFQDWGYDHIIFDTAPTGHTLRLLTLPEMMQAWTDGLIAQQQRQQKMREAASRLTSAAPVEQAKSLSSQRWLQAQEILLKRRQLFSQARDILHDAQRCAIVLVLIPEILPFEETKRAVSQLNQIHLPCAGLIINQVIDQNQADAFWQNRAKRQLQVLSMINEEFASLSKHFVALQDKDIRGLEALEALLA
ncbi:ArsA family ATPase [Basilea psittacipulmonis]|uniref:arsenite-transporting ATPase n=1 Tax=Basilea psittacipulmonis DSM 24701 TaxID=1072685 RepID=A0A077DH56_9BURK|nr:ArsA family ATPase [Basilea psittacipulmonis]AIL32772.1 arsenic ABC transporter ATPase [Basilea psittacipulmonis DSM 24701]